MFVLRSRFFSLSPRVRRVGSQLWIVTNRRTQALSLWSYRREVHVAGDARFVFIETRCFWFHRTRQALPFRHITRISYGFRQLPTSWDIFGRVHDAWETFDVYLELDESSASVLVTRFPGEGARGGVGRWLTGDDLVDYEGTQEVDSRALVEQLEEMLKVEVGPRS